MQFCRCATKLMRWERTMEKKDVWEEKTGMDTMREHGGLEPPKIYGWIRIAIYFLFNHTYGCIVNVTVHILALVLRVLLDDSNGGHIAELRVKTLTQTDLPLPSLHIVNINKDGNTQGDQHLANETEKATIGHCAVARTHHTNVGNSGPGLHCLSTKLPISVTDD